MKLQAANDFDQCVRHIDEALKIAKSCQGYRNIKLTCLIELARYDEADIMISELIARKYHGLALFFRALKLYRMGCYTECIPVCNEWIDYPGEKNEELLRCVTQRLEKAEAILKISKEGKYNKYLRGFPFNFYSFLQAMRSTR